MIRDYTKALFLIPSLQGLSSSKLIVKTGDKCVYDGSDHACIPNAVIIVFRQISQTGDEPGDPKFCMSLVQNVLPIALARPFVERFIPKGTRVSISIDINLRL